MRLGRPRTLLGLILMGLALVTLPLLVAVVRAVIELEELTAESQAVVTESVTATLENQRLARLLADMERNARQYLVLQEAGLLEIYSQNQQSVEQSLDLLEALPHDEAIATQLDRVRDTSRAVHEALQELSSESTQEQVLTSFRVMSGAARDLAQSRFACRQHH